MKRRGRLNYIGFTTAFIFYTSFAWNHKMIIALTYQVHDYQPNQIIIDSKKLSVNDLLQNKIKYAVETSIDSKVKIDGTDCYDLSNDPMLQNARINVSFPVKIDKHIYVYIDFDC